MQLLSDEAAPPKPLKGPWRHACGPAENQPVRAVLTAERSRNIWTHMQVFPLPVIGKFPAGLL